MYGYNGLEMISTKRCCQERNFWKKALGIVDDYIASSASDDDLDEIKVADPPITAPVAYKRQAAEDFVGFISGELNRAPAHLKAIVVDGEWRLGVAKVEVLIIGTMTHKVYLFHIAEICKGRRRSASCSETVASRQHHN